MNGEAADIFMNRARTQGTAKQLVARPTVAEKECRVNNDTLLIGGENNNNNNIRSLTTPEANETKI